MSSTRLAAQRCGVGRRIGRRSPGRRDDAGSCRQYNVEPCALVRHDVTVTRPPCASAMRLHQAQAETVAVNLLIDRVPAAIERLEHVPEILGVECPRPRSLTAIMDVIGRRAATCSRSR